MNSTRIAACTLVMLLAVVDQVKPAEPAAESRVAEALRVTTAAAKRYEFAIGVDQPRKLKFLPGSILRWSNPVAGEIYGNVFVWTDEGRPQVIASFLQWYSPNTHGAHEFHSLALEPLRGQRDGEPVWELEQPGIKLQRVPEQQAVAESKLGRLRQMRAISRMFKVQKTDREGVSREMRLQTQPVYRYPKSTPQVLDGALFMFVQGTDPEVVLMVEARQALDKWDWQYALMRMNSVQFVAKCRGKEVWRVETWPWSKVKNGREVYTHFGPFNLPEASK